MIIIPDISGETEIFLQELASLEQDLKKLRPDASLTTIREAALVMLGRARVVEAEAALSSLASVFTSPTLPKDAELLGTVNKGLGIA